MEIRRVVTGYDDARRPAVLSDGPAPASVELPPAVGAALVDLWRSASLPLGTTGTDDPTTGAFDLMPAGCLFRIIELEPGHHDPLWHTTATVDFVYVASGEVTVRYGDATEPDGQVVLHAGDTVVQRGLPHAWVNDGPAPCRLVNVSVAATLPPGVAPDVPGRAG